MDVESLKESFVHNLEFALAKDEFSATAARQVQQPGADGARQAHRALDRDPAELLPTEMQEGLLPVPGVSHWPRPGQCGHQSGPREEHRAGDAGAREQLGGAAGARARCRPGKRRPGTPGGVLPGFHGDACPALPTAMASATSTGSFSRRFAEGPRSRRRTTGCAMATRGRSSDPSICIRCISTEG